MGGQCKQWMTFYIHRHISLALSSKRVEGVIVVNVFVYTETYTETYTFRLLLRQAKALQCIWLSKGQKSLVVTIGRLTLLSTISEVGQSCLCRVGWLNSYLLM